MKLTRPLAFFDLETTGTNVELDRIVEIAVITHFPDGRSETWRALINPQRHIPASASKIHGITDADVCDALTFPEVASDLAARLYGSDLAGFNILGFDLPMLEAEFRRAKVAFTADGRALVDAMKLFHKYEPRDLTGAVKFYLGAAHEGAHGALADTEATIDVLMAQVARYGLEGDAEALAKLCIDPDAVDRDGKFKKDPDGKIVFAFGKYKGEHLAAVLKEDRGFLDWMMRSNFTASTKTVVKKALDWRPHGYLPPEDQGELAGYEGDI
jgi:DNA polymerase-3 subunit epsilon